MSEDNNQDVQLKSAETESNDLAATQSNEHPISDAIDVFLHKSADIKSSVVFVLLAAQLRLKRFEELRKNLDEGAASLNADVIAGIRKTHRALRDLERFRKSEQHEVIKASLFLGLFSAFDAFMGRLVSAIFKRKPELYTGISRTLEVSEVLRFKSFEELHRSVLRDEIEDLRRKSYVDQFKELESRFGIKLRAFEGWPRFVECAQRRNLLTHCDGEVSEQYLDVCEREGYEFATKPALGEKLDLDSNYFMEACDLLGEVALKLGHTLWRKVLPTEIGEADKELNEAIFNRLQTEDFVQAEVYARFACGQPNVSSDLYRRLFVVNLAIALKSRNKAEQTGAVLREIDWSACALDFRLAEAVLNDRITEACEFMRAVGKKGQLIEEHSYHVWPLFRTFRTNPQFLESYESIYGRPFTAELQKAADKAQIETGVAVAAVTPVVVLESEHDCHEHNISQSNPKH